MRIGLPLLFLIATLSGQEETHGPIHRFTMPRIDGQAESLSVYRGRTLLLVNVASRCGLTPQYEQLQALATRYAPAGLTVLGFPSNDFRGQEPGSDAEIAAFCAAKYQVTFPLFSKIVVTGPDKAPLYRYLTEDSPAKGEVTWNFQKYLVNRDGEVLAAFDPRMKPDDPRIIAAIEGALGTDPKKIVGPSGLAAAAYRLGLTRAAASERELLVQFGADACGACKTLEAALEQPEVATILSRDFVFVRLSTDQMPDGEAWLRHLGGAGPSSLPSLVWIDAKGKPVARSETTSASASTPFTTAQIDALVESLKARARRATPEQVSTLERLLRAALGAGQ